MVKSNNRAMARSKESAPVSVRRWRATHCVPTAGVQVVLLALLASIASSGQHDAPAWVTPCPPRLLRWAAATSCPRSSSVLGSARASAPFVGCFPRRPQEAWADRGSVENRAGRSSGYRFSVRMDVAGRAGGGAKEGADQKAVCPSCYAPVPASTVVCPACGDLILLGGTKVRAT